MHRKLSRGFLFELGPKAKIALEATYGWDWLVEYIEEEGHEFHLPTSSGDTGDRLGAGQGRCA